MIRQRAIAAPTRWHVLQPRRQTLPRGMAWWFRRLADPYDLFGPKAVILGLIFCAGAWLGT